MYCVLYALCILSHKILTFIILTYTTHTNTHCSYMYIYTLETWLNPILKAITEEQVATGYRWTPCRLIHRLGWLAYVYVYRVCMV